MDTLNTPQETMKDNKRGKSINYKRLFLSGIVSLGLYASPAYGETETFHVGKPRLNLSESVQEQKEYNPSLSQDISVETPQGLRVEAPTFSSSPSELELYAGNIVGKPKKIFNSTYDMVTGTLAEGYTAGKVIVTAPRGTDRLGAVYEAGKKSTSLVVGLAQEIGSVPFTIVRPISKVFVETPYTYAKDYVLNWLAHDCMSE
jgi:hypothetical protein